MRKAIKRVLGFLLVVIVVLTENGVIANAATVTGQVPIIAYTLNGRVLTYKSVNGRYSGYIVQSDQCTILEVYDSGWVKVKYPVRWGYKTAYTQSSNFFTNVNFNASTTTLGKNLSVYRRADLSAKLGTVYASDDVIIVGNNGTNTQIIYPISGGYKMGWVSGIYYDSTYGVETKIDDGYYQIKSGLNTDYVIDIYGAYTEDEANVQLYENYGTLNQAFLIKEEKNGYYTIEALHSNKVLDVYKDGKESGSNVIQCGKHGGDNQLWKIYRTSDGYYRFQSKSSGLFLDVCGAIVANETNIHIWESNTSGAQKFVLQEVLVDGKEYQGFKAEDTASVAMSTALYNSTGGYLSCGFDGYTTTSGRHEGIDFVKGYGAAVYSLTDGVVTRVKEGYNGAGGLSTIAIYSESTGKTVIYLHANPLDSLKVGQSISKGQQIATEAWRGCSSSYGTHTHVEMRNGKQSYAAISVNDYTLDNEDPTGFWNSQGYLVK